MNIILLPQLCNFSLHYWGTITRLVICCDCCVCRQFLPSLTYLQIAHIHLIPLPIQWYNQFLEAGTKCEIIFRISYSVIPMPWNISSMMQIFLLMIDAQNSFIPISWIVQIVSHEELSVIFAKKWNVTNYKFFIREGNLPINKILWVPIVWSLIIAIDLPSWSIISSVPIIYVSVHGCCQLLKLDLPICSNNRLCDLKEGSSNGQ